MKRILISLTLAGMFGLAGPAATAAAAPCLIVTLTGTQGGPSVFNGLAGSGTLLRYGDDSNDCGAVRLQFDAGRGTSMRLSQLGVTPAQINAVFFTHMHSDHADGFADLVQLRWHFNAKGPKLDMVCSADQPSPQGYGISCGKFATHIADAYLKSGEIAQRHSEDKTRPEGGPAALINTVAFEPKDEPQQVWTSGDVKVSAIRSTHIAGHASYRVDTPAGSVVMVRSDWSKRWPDAARIQPADGRFPGATPHMLRAASQLPRRTPLRTPPPRPSRPRLRPSGSLPRAP